MLITPNEILISFENSTVFQIKLDVSIKSVQKFCNMAIICFGCNFANWLSEMKIMNEIVEIASKVGWHSRYSPVQAAQAPATSTFTVRSRLWSPVLWTDWLTD